MLNKPFVNEVFNHAIELYLKYKEKEQEPLFYSFLVQCIRTLVYIYGELDILNPYITQNEHNMGGFDNNITKYGFQNIEDFKQQFILFQEEEKKSSFPNTAFLQIEKYLMDMYFCKKRTMKEEFDEKIKDYFYLSDNKNPMMMQEKLKYSFQEDELSSYFESKLFSSNHTFTLEKIQRKTLNEEAYSLLGYKKEQIDNLTNQDLDNVNKEVYKFFMVDANSLNKEELLDKAVNYYKRYGNRITSGNGFVDFLLFLSVFATAAFISILFAFHYL